MNRLHDQHKWGRWLHIDRGMSGHYWIRRCRHWGCKAIDTSDTNPNPKRRDCTSIKET